MTPAVGTARATSRRGPRVKTNITIPSELLTALHQVLLTRQKAARSRGDKGPRGTSELISEALAPWLAGKRDPASAAGTARATSHRGPLVKTNVVFRRDQFDALYQVLLASRQAALSRGDKGPRGISEFISEALDLWLVSKRDPADMQRHSHPELERRIQALEDKLAGWARRHERDG